MANNAPFTRFVAKDPDTNRIVQDLYDKLAQIQRQLAETTAALDAFQKSAAATPVAPAPLLLDAILAGDVTGPARANTVGKIQNRAVSAAAPSVNDVLEWNGSTWTPTAVPSAPVTSVFGRTGAVVAQAGDYSVAQLTGLPIPITQGGTGSSNGSILGNGTLTFQSGGSFQLILKPTTDATNAVQVQNAAGTGILFADTINKRIGINAVPGEALTVSGTGAVEQRIKSTTTGSVNGAHSYLDRGDLANGFAQLLWATAGTIEWDVFMAPGSHSLGFYDFGSTTYRFYLEQGTGNVGVGTTTPSSVAGSGIVLEVANPTNGFSTVVTSNSATSGSSKGSTWEVKSTATLTGGDARLGLITFLRQADVTAGKLTTTCDLYINNDGTILQSLHITPATIAVATPVRLKTYTVAGLPAGGAGDTAIVTNALGPTFGAAVVGGGLVTVPVYYDGVSWKVG